MKGLSDSCSTDRISNLPEVLADHIVTFLLLKDAAKAATLSTQWRYCWRNVPQLVFDSDFARTRWSESESNVHDLMNKIFTKLRFSIIANPTTKFVLAIPGLRPCDEIDHFILYLANNKKLKDFTLRILHESGWYRMFMTSGISLVCCY
ncbi:unnamed protein product [Linum trigynum]|uniref:F-box domain-containing protein n=1 Tax=Linum trigynum TaxID=586398 RepID=A0AAV2F3H1_9ROSI